MDETNKIEKIEKVEKQICTLQYAHISLQEQLKNTHNKFERNLEDAALKIIDILDMMENARTHLNLCDALNSRANANAELILHKIEKRLSAVLQCLQVQEISLTDGQNEIGTIRVIDTKTSLITSSKGEILEVCRKGYKRGTKIIRAADVIVAA